MGATARALVTAGLAAAAGRTASRALASTPPGGKALWDRTNHRGEPITLLEGPAYVAGATVAVATAPGVPARVRLAALVAGTAAGALGAYDDLAEGGVRKGLAGHLGALARGEVTTGAVKVLGLAASGVVASALAARPGQRETRRGGTPSAAARVVDVLVGGAVVAGSANLVNLLDLRPGRALKAVLLMAPAALVGGPGAAPLAAAAGAAAAALPDDLAERSMLGDTGANAAGALLGVAAVAGLRPRGRAALLAGLVALTVASEKVSFTRVIEATPGLRDLDALGRRPVEARPGSATGVATAPPRPAGT
jgi:UDP-N-acetylmuramyl pentapeptide phosphotransferase/UDP-N-acetylglucosamine-1-phosphate transferase